VVPVVRRWWWVGALALVVVGVLLWSIWPAGQAEPRAREYRDVTACLLTDEQGVAGAQAAPVWEGMQDASLKTHGQVKYLAIAGEQNKDNASSFLGSLVVGRCAVIVAVGQSRSRWSSTRRTWRRTGCSRCPCRA
jgi:hypothetical protein